MLKACRVVFSVCMATEEIESSSSSNSKRKYKSISTSMTESQLASLNQRLKLFGFESAGELIHAFGEGKFPPPKFYRRQRN